MTSPSTSLPPSSVNPRVARTLLPHAEEQCRFWSDVIKRFEQDIEYARGQYRRANEDIMKYREVLESEDQDHAV